MWNHCPPYLMKLAAVFDANVQLEAPPTVISPPELLITISIVPFSLLGNPIVPPGLEL